MTVVKLPADRPRTAPTAGDPETKPAPGASVLAALAEIPDPPERPVFVPDTTAPLPERVARLLAHKVASLEAEAAGGGDVPVLELARLADQVAGRAAVPAASDDSAEHYDWGRLDLADIHTLEAIYEKARVR